MYKQGHEVRALQVAHTSRKKNIWVLPHSFPTGEREKLHFCAFTSSALTQKCLLQIVLTRSMSLKVFQRKLTEGIAG